MRQMAANMKSATDRLQITAVRRTHKLDSAIVRSIVSGGNHISTGRAEMPPL